MDAKSAQRLTNKTTEAINKKRWAEKKKKEEQHQNVLKMQATSLSEHIRKNLDKDIKKAASSGIRHITYGGSYLDVCTLNSSYMDAIKKELRAKGFKVECDSRDVDMGKIDIDYWGCTDEIRDMCVSW